MDEIYSRRSIRRYTEEKVSDELIRDLLRSAMYAPSAGNERPWHFIVIRDRDILTRITDFHPYSSMLPSAACAIIVCADLRLERYKGMWVQDCSAATMNILLAAESHGLGAVWLGVYPEEDRVNPLRELLHLPESVLPLSICSVGYPAETRKVDERYDESRVHTDRW